MEVSVAFPPGLRMCGAQASFTLEDKQQGAHL